MRKILCVIQKLVTGKSGTEQRKNKQRNHMAYVAYHADENEHDKQQHNDKAGEDIGTKPRIHFETGNTS